jgi:Sec-independent protein translocase protein TatA
MRPVAPFGAVKLAQLARVLGRLIDVLRGKATRMNNSTSKGHSLKPGALIIFQVKP